MDLDGLNMGFSICGSFCTISSAIEQIKHLKSLGVNIYPIMSFNVTKTDTRFGRSSDIISTVENITENKIIDSIELAEPIGPEKKLDIMVVAPCTGNTLAKINNGITDTPVTMAVKAHIRNNKPVVIALATNDALGVTLKNIGGLIIRKNMYFVPFGQDNYKSKPLSMVADFGQIEETVKFALAGEQIQPLLI